MSTSTLGGFDREQRKLYYDAYLFQRRILFGCTISIGVSFIVWFFAILSDQWIVVNGRSALYVPSNGNYFLSSQTGLWRSCRIVLIPEFLPNSTLPRSLSTIVYTNPAHIQKLKTALAAQNDIIEFYNNNLGDVKSITTIDDTFKQALFANWLRNATAFNALKAKYKDIVAIPGPNPAGPRIGEYAETDVRSNFDVVFITNVETNKQVIIPKSLNDALFVGWEKKPKLVYLLGAFANAMEIPLIYLDKNGTERIIRPPQPTKKQHKNENYKYVSHEKCRYHSFVPASVDPELAAGDGIFGPKNNSRTHLRHIDEIEDLTKTEASFACIGLLIMIMGFIFSIYTFLNPRYMFKRLAAGVHFISASLCFVVLQVLYNSVDYENENLKYIYPPGVEYSYGYAVYLSWLVFIANGFAFIMFLWYSRKKKGDKAPTEEMAMADEPINIGR